MLSLCLLLSYSLSIEIKGLASDNSGNMGSYLQHMIKFSVLKYMHSIIFTYGSNYYSFQPSKQLVDSVSVSGESKHCSLVCMECSCSFSMHRILQLGALITPANFWKTAVTKLNLEAILTKFKFSWK